MATGAGPDAMYDELDLKVTELDGQVPSLEEQASRLKEVAQKLDPSEARDSARAVVASAQALAREVSNAKARCDKLAEDGVPASKASLIGGRAARLAERVEKSRAQAAHVLSLAQLKVSRAMEALRVQVSFAVHAHMATKKKSSEDIFDVADADGDGMVNRSEFFALVRDVCGEARFSQDQLGRLFNYTDEDSMGKLGKEDFQRLFRIFYKVSRPKVELYQTMGISQGRKVRALDIDEVVELLEGPVKEANGSVRVRCRAMSDNAEGWTVEKGNTGTPFLCQNRIHYKVIKSTVLSTEFRLDENSAIRTLDENELVEVRIWEKLERHSGVKRLKGRANKDGAVGWVTTISNTGTKFLEMV